MHVKPNQKIGKNLVIYFGTSWVFMEAIDFFIERYNFEPLLLDIIILFLFFGIFSTIVFSAFQGRWNKMAVGLQVFFIVSAVSTVGYFVIHPLSFNPRSIRIITLSKNKSQLRNLSSVAVLPIQNNLPNQDNDYLLAGLHDGIITELGKLGTLKTISRTSTLPYAATNKSLKKIGYELDVNSILESSLSLSNDGYVYRVRLLDSDSEELLWSDEFSTQVSELPTLFEEVSQIIAIKLNPDIKENVRVHEDVNPEAYEQILKGNHLLQKFAHKEMKESIDHFKKAIELDSTNLEGYIGVSMAWIYMQQIGLVDPKIARPNIFKYGEKAVSIDPEHWKSHAYRGAKSFLIDYDFVEGIKMLEKSLALNSNNSDVRSSLAHFYMLVNDWDNAWEQIRYAKEIDPLNPQVISFEAIMYLNQNKVLSGYKLFKTLRIIDRQSFFVELASVGMNRDFGNSKNAIEAMKKLHEDDINHPIELNKFIDLEFKKSKDVNLTWLAVLRYLKKHDYQKYYPSNTARILYSFLQGYDDNLFFECLNQMANDKHPDIPYYARKDGNLLQDDLRYIRIMEDLKLW